jgi:hypothetical protein
MAVRRAAPVLVAFLAACGGGGGGGGGTSATTSGNVAAPASGPGDVSAYYPLTVGSNWLYDETQTDSKGATTYGQASVSNTGTQTVLGATVSAFSLSSTVPGFTPHNQYYGASGGGVTFYGTTDPSDPLTNHMVPYAQLLFPVAAGPVSHVVASGWTIGTDSANSPITTTIDQQIAVAGFETVTVNAGVFANAAKVVTTTTGTANDARTVNRFRSRRPIRCGWRRASAKSRKSLPVWPTAPGY